MGSNPLQCGYLSPRSNDRAHSVFVRPNRLRIFICLQSPQSGDKSPQSKEPFFWFLALLCERMFSYDEGSKRPGELVSPLQGYPGRYVG